MRKTSLILFWQFKWPTGSRDGEEQGANKNNQGRPLSKVDLLLGFCHAVAGSSRWGSRPAFRLPAQQRISLVSYNCIDCIFWAVYTVRHGRRHSHSHFCIDFPPTDGSVEYDRKAMERRAGQSARAASR